MGTPLSFRVISDYRKPTDDIPSYYKMKSRIDSSVSSNAATTIEKEDGIVDSSISSTEDTYSKVPIHFSENMKSTTNKLDKIVGQSLQTQDDTDNKIKFLE